MKKKTRTDNTKLPKVQRNKDITKNNSTLLSKLNDVSSIQNAEININKSVRTFHASNTILISLSLAIKSCYIY